MSHGEERKSGQVVLDKSDNGLRTSWIEDQFSNNNCDLFSGKPKIFLYQLCRYLLNIFVDYLYLFNFIDLYKFVCLLSDKLKNLECYCMF